MRPGRLDRILYVGPPDSAGREEILRIRTRNMTIESGIDFAQLSVLVSTKTRLLLQTLTLVSQTEGCSGAELAAMCQEAAMTAMREDIHAPLVSHKHFLAAASRVRRGIKPADVEHYRHWRERSGLTEV